MDGRGFTLVGAQAIDDAASALGADPHDAAGAAAVAGRLGLNVLVGGRLSAAGGTRRAVIFVRSGHDGALAGEEAWTAPSPVRLGRSVARGFWSRLGFTIGMAAGRGTAVPPGPEPPAAGKVPVVSVVAPTAPPTAGPRHPRGFELELGPRFFSRHLSFSSDPNGVLRDFRTRSFAPSLGGRAIWFPWAGRGGALGALGISGAIEHGLSLESSTSDGRTYESPHRSLDGAVRLRGSFGPLEAEALAGGGRHGLALSPRGAAADLPAVVPDVDYRFMRGGMAVRLRTRTAILLAEAGYRHILGAGPIAGENWFPATSARGLDALLALSLPVVDAVELRFGADLRRYSLTFAQGEGGVPSDGARDSFVSVWAAVVLGFGGQPR